MNANGLDRGAMTRSSTTSGETVPWLSSITSCQVQAHRIPSTSLTSSTPSHEPHFMLPGIPSSTLTGLYRQSLTLPELSSRHPYPQIYTTTASAPYPPSSLYAAHGQPAGVPSLSPYGMYYNPYHHPGYSPAPSTGDMQSFSQLIARISQQAQPQQLPRPYPSHVPHQYASQPLASPTGSPGPTPHPPTHPSPIQQLPHSALYREHPTPHKPETRRVSSRTSPLQTEKPHLRHSPLTTAHRPDHYPGLSSKDLPPPKESRESSFPAKPPGADSGEYVRHLAGSLRRAPHEQQQAMSSEPYAAGVHVKAEESPSKKAKLGPPPLQPQAPSTHTVTTGSPSPSSSMLPPPPPLQPASYTSQPHYPAHFMKGSIIQLANGELKRVEDLRTEDFVNSAEISPDLKIDSSTVVRIEKDEQRGTAILGFSVGTQRIQVTVEATLEHPFYVFGRGWSSCSPERTSRRYGLSCCRLGVGDVCISLTQKETPSSSSAGATPTPTTAASASATGVVLTSTTGSSSHRASSASPKHRPISGRHQTTEHKRWTSSEGGGGAKKSPDGADTDASHPLPLETALPHVGSSLVPQGAVPQGDPAGAGHVTGAPGPPTVRKRRWSAPDHLRTDSRAERASPAARHAQQPSQHVQQQAQHQQQQQQQQQPAAGEPDQPATQPQQQLLLHQPKDQQTAKQQQAKQAPKSSEAHRQT